MYDYRAHMHKGRRHVIACLCWFLRNYMNLKGDAGKHRKIKLTLSLVYSWELRQIIHTYTLWSSAAEIVLYTT